MICEKESVYTGVIGFAANLCVAERGKKFRQRRGVRMADLDRDQSTRKQVLAGIRGKSPNDRRAVRAAIECEARVVLNLALQRRDGFGFDVRQILDDHIVSLI